MRRNAKFAAYAIALAIAVTSMTGAATKTVHAEEETGTESINVIRIGEDTDPPAGLEVTGTTDKAESTVYEPETDVQMDEQTVGAQVAPYYNLNANGGSWNGTNYLLNGQVITDAFFCDGTYTYYLQFDGTPMKDRLTYHPDGVHIIYFDEDGHEVFDNFAHISETIAGQETNDVCYFNTYGYMYVDVLTWDPAGEEIIYITPYGVVQTDGWFQYSSTVKWADGTSATEYWNNYGGCDSGYVIRDAWGFDWEDRLTYLQGNGVCTYPKMTADGVASMIAASIGPGTDLERVNYAASIVAFICANDTYTTEGSYYNKPEGVFIRREYSCAGATRALGLVLNYMGYSWSHVNENQWTHQWCELMMDGQKGYADGMGGFAGYGAFPY